MTYALNQPTLVLNASWTAIATTTVRNALQLMYTRAAKAVEPDSYEIHGFESWADLAVGPDQPCIRTVRMSIRVPEIVVLTRYTGKPNTTAVFSRRNLFRRDHDKCQYCGRRPGGSELSIDHVLPRSRGGVCSWENCVLACTSCNLKKRDRTPEQAGMKLLKRPVRPKWSPLFEIPLGRVRQSWERFVSEAYWNVELEP